jgi:predicted ferric reductase
MKNIRVALAALLLWLSLLWAVSEPVFSTATSVMAMRDSVVVGSGVLAIGMMAAALLLATRPVWAEPWLGGLDKMVRLHRWLGIGVLAAALLHWLAVQAPGWAVDAGLWLRPPRSPRPTPESGLLDVWQQWRGPAESMGAWAFYAMLLLLVLALVPRFPHHLFFKTHRLLALAYGVLVLHAVLLLPLPAWRAPLGPLLLLWMLAGLVAAGRVLGNRVGQGRRAVAEVETVVQHPTSHVLELGVRLHSRWRGHRPGQFAFVTFHPAEGPHPFTITSAWRHSGRLQFLVKELGDYTRRLPGLVAVGDLVQVEGPYGRFNFDSTRARQVWVGGGIGITPFIARLQQLAAWPNGRPVDLFYTTSLLDAQGVASLRADALAAGITLHVLVDSEDGRLSAAHIREAVPDWCSGSVWFCGPAAFGAALRHDMLALGLARNAFHQELFALRG